jgi:cytochrome P450
MPEIWPEPERYEPMRFGAASRGCHKFAKCLGLNFAYMQANCFAWHFLNDFRVTIARDYDPKWRMWPIP